VVKGKLAEQRNLLKRKRKVLEVKGNLLKEKGKSSRRKSNKNMKGGGGETYFSFKRHWTNKYDPSQSFSKISIYDVGYNNETTDLHCFICGIKIINIKKAASKLTPEQLNMPYIKNTTGLPEEQKRRLILLDKDTYGIPTSDGSRKPKTIVNFINKSPKMATMNYYINYINYIYKSNEITDIYDKEGKDIAIKIRNNKAPIEDHLNKHTIVGIVYVHTTCLESSESTA
jgi:hypothetical protein